MTDPADDLVTITIACQLIGGKETPITPSTLYKGVKTGRFPAPIKIGPGTSRWRRSEILAMLDKAAADREVAA
ncbi:AlpA family transcriptional regulator [Aliihoeflea sp. 40Bstr573]|uniref:helix-turn-helix transcriptional regulator n=1 Tax=Aliihoeflea sp. 40Bstr573 TaxID=2696467 RepID=UPI002095FA80|nr:AlpA family phage regulatory protein [Aliihoeflea sp. 40Bstr573]MCO6385921.1 AlpA family phage regulatory protein [Aliihoeflea sp. 40Bstr573]